MTKTVETKSQNIKYLKTDKGIDREITEVQEMNVEGIKQDLNMFKESIKSFHIGIDSAEKAIEKDKENINTYTEAYNKGYKVLEEITNVDESIELPAKITDFSLEALNKLDEEKNKQIREESKQLKGGGTEAQPIKQ